MTLKTHQNHTKRGPGAAPGGPGGGPGGPGGAPGAPVLISEVLAPKTLVNRVRISPFGTILRWSEAIRLLHLLGWPGAASGAILGPF